MQGAHGRHSSYMINRPRVAVPGVDTRSEVPGATSASCPVSTWSSADHPRAQARTKESHDWTSHLSPLPYPQVKTAHRAFLPVNPRRTSQKGNTGPKL